LARRHGARAGDAPEDWMDGATAPTAFFAKTFDETLALLEAARGYLAYREHAPRRALEPLDRLKLSREAYRITTRLTEIMAWLLVRKAVHAGELTAAEAARPEHRLSHRDLCAAELAPDCAGLPDGLVDLAERSRRLYVRVTRLDDMLDVDA